MKKSNVMRILSAALVFVMVFGLFTFFAPEGIVLSASALSYDGSGSTSFGNSEKIRIINHTRADKGKGKSDAIYAFDGMTWKAADEDNYIVWEGTDENTFYGVYPATAEYDKFNIPANQSGGVQDADWMTDDYTAKKSESEGVQLTFAHRLAKVTVNITKWNSEFEDAEKVISTPKIYSNGSEIKITYATSADGADAYTVDGVPTAIVPKVSDGTYTAIVAPTRYTTTDKFMTFTAGGQEMTVLANTAELTAGLQPGKHYTFNLTVGKDAVSIASVTVAGWTDREINGVESDELLVFTNREGKVSNVTISAGASAQDVKNAIGEELTSGMTTLMIEGVPTEAQQEAIAEALTEKTDVDLIMGEVTNPVSDITALTNIDLAYQNGAGENGYAVVDGTYVITAKSGLDAWRAAAGSDASTNLTLACDVEYNAVWSKLNNTYNGTIDGNGYAIKGLKSFGDKAFFIEILGTDGVIKHLGMVDGDFSSSVTDFGAGAYAFVYRNNGVIMGCYNTSTCISTTTEGYGYAAGLANYNNGTIIACYNAGEIKGGARAGGGICYRNDEMVTGCYNTGTVTSNRQSDYPPGGIVYQNQNGVDVGTIKDCYYSKPNKGIGSNLESYQGNQSNLTRWTNSNWSEPMNAMNAAIEAYNADEANTVKCNYRYVLNTDAATKDAQPLVIVKAES